MNASPVSVHTLFRINVQYRVPLYQRRYVWGEVNWKDLWKDISIQEELKSKTKGHFIGPIVTRLIKGQQKRYEVIDGQQRLLTFQIIFCIIRDLCQLLEFPDLEAKAKDHLQNGENAIQRFKKTDPLQKLPDPMYKFVPTDYDELAFKKIVKKKYGKKIHEAFDENKKCLDEDEVKKIILELFKKKKVSHSILDAYNYFYKEIRNHVEEDPKKKITNLLQTIKSNFELVQITPGQSQRAEEIFESINATGRKLSDFDYLRNNLFLRARDKSEKFYRYFWIFEDDRDYDWTDDRLESFFQAFLMAKLGPKILNKDTKLFDLYQLQVSPGRTLEEEFEDIKNYALIYKELDVDPHFGSRMQFYKDLSTFYTEENEESYNPVKGTEYNYYNYYVTVIRSFIMCLREKFKSSKNEILRVFEILESYVARSVLVDTVANYDSYQVIRTFFSDLFLEQGKEFTIGNMIEYLANRSKRRWVPNTVIKDWFVGKKLLITWHGSLREDQLFSLRYIFFRIENWKRTAAGKEPLIFTKKEFPSDKNSVCTFRQLERDEEAWRSLGNLTFCWRDNHDQEIKTFNDIKAFLQEGRNGTLELNSEIYNERILEWKRREIKDRENKLVSVFCNLWPPYPWENIDMRYSVNQEVQGTVVRITEDGMYVQLEPAVEGYVSIWEMTWSTHRKIIPSEHFNEGTQIKVKILDIEESKQEIRLSIRQTQPNPWIDIETRYSVNQEVEGTVVEIDQSGITLELEQGIGGRVEDSEIAWTSDRIIPSEHFKQGDKVIAKILKISKDEPEILLSTKQTQYNNPWKDIETRYFAGTEVQGTVVKIDRYGATFELEPGVHGSIHRDEMVWTNSIKDIVPSEIVNEGEEIKAKILEISEEKENLQLSIKQTQPDPWIKFTQNNKEGAIVRGKIHTITNFGAFAELEEGISGLIRTSELTDRWLEKPEEVVSLGEKLDLKIIKIDQKKRRVRLSLKAVPWTDIETRYLVNQEVEGTVIEIDQSGITLELEQGIGGRVKDSEIAWTSDRIIPSEHFKQSDKVIAKILEISEAEQRILLSIKQTQPDPLVKFIQNNKEGTVVRGKIHTITNSGAFAELEEGVLGLIHTSELTDRWLEKPEEVVSLGEKLDLKVIKIDQRERHVHLSLKAVWMKIAEKYRVGAVVQGKIVKLGTFGALVELEEGIEGLIIEGLIKKHELAGRFEKLSVGTELKVRVTKMDQEKRQIHLSSKAIWMKIAEKYRVGAVVQGKIVKLGTFGALVELEEGIEGLIIEGLIKKHELAGRFEKLSVGTELKVRVTKMDQEKRQIHLSSKAIWMKIVEKYKVGAVVQGKIVKLGIDALVELEEGIEGLIIEGLIKKHKLTGGLERLSVGTELKVRVLKVDQEKRQIHLQEVTPTLMETLIIAAMKRKH